MAPSWTSLRGFRASSGENHELDSPNKSHGEFFFNQLVNVMTLIPDSICSVTVPSASRLYADSLNLGNH